MSKKTKTAEIQIPVDPAETVTLQLTVAEAEQIKKLQARHEAQKVKHREYQQKHQADQKVKRQEVAVQVLLDTYSERCHDHKPECPFTYRKRLIVPELFGLRGLRVWYRDVEQQFIPLNDKA